jgi:hypothetical protein
MSCLEASKFVNQQGISSKGLGGAASSNSSDASAGDASGGTLWLRDIGEAIEISIGDMA